MDCLGLLRGPCQYRLVEESFGRSQQPLSPTSRREELRRHGRVEHRNAFGDKRALYRKALDHYVEGSIADRMRRCEKLALRETISAFLAEIVKRSLEDPYRQNFSLSEPILRVLITVTRHPSPFGVGLLVRVTCRKADMFRPMPAQLAMRAEMTGTALHHGI